MKINIVLLFFAMAVNSGIEKPNYKIHPNMLKNLLIGTFWFKNKLIVENLPIVD